MYPLNTSPCPLEPSLAMYSYSSNHTDTADVFPHRRYVWVTGPVIIGAGPSGLAVAAGLRTRGIPFLILERSDCLASLWQYRTYDRLRLHLPKRHCQLPLLPFSPQVPTYPSRSDFLSYLHSYADHFNICPLFRQLVVSARYDEHGQVWRVRSKGEDGEVEYVCQWVVAATGENAEPAVPEMEGEFGAEVVHASEYRCGERYRGKRVVVVGCGNSGMEVCLDLCEHGAFPSIVVRDSVHVLPREILGKSTFELAMVLMRWLSLRLADKVLLFLSWFVLGNLEKYGLRRPPTGPLELKNRDGRTPVLDVGALAKIRTGEIKVVPAIRRFSSRKVELVDGRVVEADAVVFATGYRSNVPSWLQDTDLFSRNGHPKDSFPNGWKGKRGLYAVGFTGRGLSGASLDAVRVSEDISKEWNQEIQPIHDMTDPTHKLC